MVLSRDKGIYDDILPMCNADGADTSLGYAGNHQLSDVHAAMARTRLTLAAGEQHRRMRLASLFDEWFADKATCPVSSPVESCYFRYIVRTNGNAADAIKALHGQGVGACLPVPAPVSSLYGANRAWDSCVSLPLLEDFSDAELQQMKEAITVCFS